MLDYASLKAVATVVREGSFGRAARVLHVTAPALSQRIKVLEDRIGCVLIVRGKPARGGERRQPGDLVHGGDARVHATPDGAPGPDAR